MSNMVEEMNEDHDAIADVGEEKSDKRHLVAVFIGHVDAGKSTMAGQILVLTGQIDARTIKKYEKEAKDKNRESWYMAYIMDTDEEERAKGITVEVGRAHFKTETTRFTILDAPGHKNYVPNMISGASQADIGVVPIAPVNEFVAQLQILELVDNAIFTAGYKAMLHIHCVVEECEIIELFHQIDPKTKKRMKKKVVFVKDGDVVLCRVQVNKLICIEKFSDFPQLGRFTLRTEGKTVAVGKVTDLHNVNA